MLYKRGITLISFYKPLKDRPPSGLAMAVAE